MNSIESLLKEEFLKFRLYLRKYQNFFPLILLFLFLASSLLAYFFYYRAKKLEENPRYISQKEVSKLINSVSKLLSLPEGEEPTIATVSAPERLRDQPFFSKAKEGDKVLLYSGAKRAILYRPSDNKIIEVAPLNINDSFSSNQSDKKKNKH